MRIIPRMPLSRFSFLLLLLFALGCERQREPAPATTAVSIPFDSTPVARGEALYRQHCAQCHGPLAQGHPDWQTPSDGSFAAAPPLDASGPAPRRTQQQLVATIKEGIYKEGVEVMPNWGARLSEAEIVAVIAYFQSLWPAEVYAAWLQRAAASVN